MHSEGGWEKCTTLQIHKGKEQNKQENTQSTGCSAGIDTNYLLIAQARKHEIS